jgi:hypothetical protein
MILVCQITTDVRVPRYHRMLVEEICKWSIVTGIVLESFHWCRINFQWLLSITHDSYACSEWNLEKLWFDKVWDVMSMADLWDLAEELIWHLLVLTLHGYITLISKTSLETSLLVMKNLRMLGRISYCYIRYVVLLWALLTPIWFDNCFNRSTTMNHEDNHFKIHIGVEMRKLW